MNLKIHQLDLNLLRVFDALMQEQNLTRAAQQLHMSQPAVSNALARLRTQLGEALFVRTARGMTPTLKAQAIHGPVRAALRLLQEGLALQSEFEPSVADRRFTLAMNDYAQFALLPELMARARAQAPHVVLSVQPDVADTLPARLAAGDLDLAIDYLHFDAAELVYEPLHEEDLVVIARRGHPAFAGGLTLASYQAGAHVTISTRAGRGSPLDIVLGSVKVRRRIELHVPYFLTIPVVVAQTDLLGTIPRRLAERFAASLQLQLAPLPFSMPPVQVSLIWHRQQEASQGLQWLRQQIAESAAAVQGQP